MIKIHQWCLILTVLLFAVTLPAAEQAKIIGGIEAKQGDWPFMAGLVTADEPYSPFCGATLIATNMALTAAHCINIQTTQLRVAVGLYDVNRPEQAQIVSVKQAIIHPRYNQPMDFNNDVAILVLTEAVTSIAPIQLISPELLLQLPNEQTVTVIGWGDRAPSDTEVDFPDILHQADVNLIEQDICRQQYSDLSENMLCAGVEGGGKDACIGDSGGPLILSLAEQIYQVGVVSFGNGCGLPDFPGVYANVASLAEWIRTASSGIYIEATDLIGYFEKNYAEKKTLRIVNDSNSDVQLNELIVDSQEGFESIAIGNNECNHKILAGKSSCEFTLEFATEEAGDAQVSIAVDSGLSETESISTDIHFATLPHANSDLAQAFEANGLGVSWYTQGLRGWLSQEETFTSGTSALQSGIISDGEVSVLLGVMENVQSFSFDYKTSTELNYDEFQVIIDGETVLTDSGISADFKSVTFDLSINSKHRVQFVYKKDDSLAIGDDRVYLDNFKLTQQSTDATSESGGSLGFLTLMMCLILLLSKLAYMHKTKLNIKG